MISGVTILDDQWCQRKDTRGQRRRFANLLGRRFGRLVVVDIAGFDKKNRPEWFCACDCGATSVRALGLSLTQGWRVSCGCRRQETLEAYKTINLRHGAKSNGRTAGEYTCWQSMKDRCCNPNNQDFAYYGGRGITVCDRWRNSFEAFFEDMGARPSRRHWIDRIDCNKNYEPSNCRWATPMQQQRNRRNNRLVCWNGESLPLSAWAERLGVSYGTLRHRLDAGWSDADALSTPIAATFPAERRRCSMQTRPEEAEELSVTVRGVNGYGSTGVR